MPYQFHGQRPDEVIVLLTRRHPLVLMRPFLGATLVALIPFVLFVVMELTTAWFLIFAACFVLALFVGWHAWYGWWRTMLVLTDERVLFLRQHGFFKREFSECSLANIQQVSHNVKGVLNTLWSYGSMTIMAGAQGTIEAPDVPDPYEIQQEIQRVLAL